ncbi:FAD-dependent oxidoreductase [Microbacteriaceae bacterium K1510]|nr:FAD-dependent oxidoreductase [Microbacteriaceae bacterium K1510]
MTQRVVIIGGGIAGSALAIALARRGMTTTLIEREAQWAPLSSGLFIYSNGLAALDQLGVLDDICASGWVSLDGGNLYLSADGKTITRTLYPGIGDRIPAIVGMRRAELHRILAGAVAAYDVDVRLGTTVAAIETGDAKHAAQVTLSDGSTLTCDVLIGADGIRSQIRTLLFGALEPTYTGFGVWRSTHKKPASIDQKIMLMGVGTRLGIMPISRDELYMFGTTREPGKPFYPRDTWAREMRAKFAAFKGPAEALLAEITDAAQVFYTSVEEVHLPLPWSRGRAILIGDAAHSSSPFMGQGGAMALEDAVVLADMLDGALDVPATLDAFGERRFTRCKFVQDASRRVGEAGAIEDAAASLTRNTRMQAGAQKDVDDFYARMAEPI